MLACHMAEYFKVTNEDNKQLDKRFVTLQSWQMFLTRTAYKANFQTSFFRHLELRRGGSFSLESQVNEHSCLHLHCYPSPKPGSAHIPDKHGCLSTLHSYEFTYTVNNKIYHWGYTQQEMVQSGPVKKRSKSPGDPSTT